MLPTKPALKERSASKAAAGLLQARVRTTSPQPSPKGNWWAWLSYSKAGHPPQHQMPQLGCFSTAFAISTPTHKKTMRTRSIP